MKKYLCYLVVFLLGAAAYYGGQHVYAKYGPLFPEDSVKDSINTEFVDSTESIVVDSAVSDSTDSALA